MKEDYLLNSSVLRIEAEDFIKRIKLEDVLSKEGNIHYAGSYKFDMMCWRDIDIILELEDGKNPKDVLLNIITKFIHSESIRDIHFFDNFNFKVKDGLPKGHYLGFDIEDTRIIENWKIDIWILDKEDYISSMKFMKEIDMKITEELKNLAINVKYKLKGKNHRVPSTMSFKVYKAIFNDGLRDESEIIKYVNNA
ncbi:MAG: hypothetical protein ACI8ZF_000247 [Candidatus Midichloriaceae bacterium]|jgi:hypothetical protein